MHVFIYKTNIGRECDLLAIEDALSPCAYIRRWTVDRDDVDKVLRIESTIDNADDIIKAVKRAGYSCEALPD